MNTSLTLNQEIQQIINGKGSKAKKVIDIAKLGIPYTDAKLLLDIYAPSTEGRVRRSTYTFGVEIEMANTNRNSIEAACADNGVNIYYDMRYNHVDGHSYYKFMRDSSLEGTNPIECVSPVLKSSNGFKSLKATVKALNEADCSVNVTCGLHVHIGAKSLTEKQYCSVFVNYMHLEDLIDTFMAPSRRGDVSQWCHTLKGRGIQYCESRYDLYNHLRSRYFKVNPEAYNRHQTIEFRQHGGTLNYEKIEMWVKFVAKLVDWSKTHRLESDVNDIDELEFLTAKEKAFFKARAARFAAA